MKTNNAVNGIAPIENVRLLQQAMERATNRTVSLPGLVAFYGHSGAGKSFAACFVANRYRAYYVQLQSTMTKKYFLGQILKDMGLSPAGTSAHMTAQIAEHLATTRLPLIIDEFDYLVKKGWEDLVRDLYEGSDLPIIVIGEQRLPQKLEGTERFHSRVLEWVEAQPCSYSDADYLREIYAPDIDIEDRLMTKLMDASGGSVRRVCVNLDAVRYLCAQTKQSEISLEDWGAREFYTGKPAIRRAS